MSRSWVVAFICIAVIYALVMLVLVWSVFLHAPVSKPFNPVSQQEVDQLRKTFNKDLVDIGLDMMRELIRKEDERFRHLDSKANTFLGMLGVSMTVIVSLGALWMTRINKKNPQYPKNFRVLVGSLYLMTVLPLVISYIFSLVTTGIPPKAGQKVTPLQMSRRYDVNSEDVIGPVYRMLDPVSYKKNLIGELWRVLELNVQANDRKADWLSRSQTVSLLAVVGIVGLLLFLVVDITRPQQQARALSSPAREKRLLQKFKLMLSSLTRRTLVLIFAVTFLSGSPFTARAFHISPCEPDGEDPRWAPMRSKESYSSGWISKRSDRERLNGGWMIHIWLDDVSFRICHWTQMEELKEYRRRKVSVGEVKIKDYVKISYILWEGQGKRANIATVIQISEPQMAAEVWVTNRGDDTVTVIDTETNKVVDTITPGGKKPHGIVFTPGGAYAFVANVGTNDVNMIETKTRKVVETFPVGTKAQGPGVTPDGTQLWVANPGSNDVTVIDLQLRKKIATISVGKAPALVTFDPTGTRAYVSNGGSGDLSVIDVKSRKVTKTIKAGKGAMGTDITWDGKLLLVTAGDADRIDVIDAKTDKMKKRISREGEPQGLVVSPDGKRAYVVNRGANTVSVIDLKELKIVKEIPAGKRIDIATITPDGRRLYITSRDTNSVIVIDTATEKVIAELPVGKDPHGIAPLSAAASSFQDR